MSKIRLIASDIDGTLIKDSTPDLYPEIVTAVRELTDQGILFCAASGRQYQSIRNVFRDVERDIIYIAENGAQIRYKEQDIRVTPMKREDAEGIITHLRQYYDTCDVIVSTPEGSLIESRNQDFIDLITYGYHNKFRLVKDVLEEDAVIIKIAIYQKKSIRELGEGTLIPMWKDRVKTCMAGEDWVDFMDASVDKGYALHFIQDYFHISKEETMAFGDNDNDIGMMQAAGESYAVENARAEVKKAARNICPSYTEKGVYQVVRKLITV
jgi:HAD-superfamily hydrolase, subfamily IIB